MTLRTYLNRDGAISLTDLAAKLEVSKGRLSQLQDSTDWPPELALKVERETQGGLDAALLSPVIHEARKTAA